MAALILAVPASVPIVRAFWPYGAGEDERPGRALEALWTLLPVAALATLVWFTVTAE